MAQTSEKLVASTGTAYFQSTGSADILVADARTVFEGDYVRAGRDLQITGPDGTTITIIDYFTHQVPPTLITANGATIDGDTVSTLAGPQFPAQIAQAAQSAAGAGAPLSRIGKVQTQDGDGTIQRTDGTIVKITVDTPVYQGDVVQTAKGGKVSITFSDGTVFAVSENARMVLDKLVYDPAGSSNSMLFNLIQGTFSFIAGKIASSGNMQVETPVATMGIRGTTVVATVEAQSGASKFSLVNDPDGKLGSFVVLNKQTGQPIGTVTDTKVSLYVENVNSPPIEQPRDVNAEQPAINQVFQAYQDFQRRGDQNQDDDNGLVKKASLQVHSSGVSDAPNPADPLESYQATKVNVAAPLGNAPPLGELPPGAEGGLPPVEAPLSADAPPPEPGETGPQGPVLNLPTLTPTVSEDGSVTISGFSISSSGGPITVTITAQSTVTLASTTGLTFNSGDGTADETMQFSGQPNDIVNALNGLTYIPTPNNDGEGGITFELDDGTVAVTAKVDVTITSVPDDPIAENDQFAVQEGSTLSANVFADNGNGADSDPDTGDSFTVTQINGASGDVGNLITLTSGATVQLNSDGTFDYNPFSDAAAGQIVDDSFTYTIEDTTGRTATATVAVAVSGTGLGVTEVTDENFQGGAAGWNVTGSGDGSYVSNKTDATEAAAFTEFLGRFGDSNDDPGISKTFALSGNQDSVTVKFDFYEINSWDGDVTAGEAFNVFTNGNQVISDAHQMFNGGIVPAHAETSAAPASLGFANPPPSVAGYDLDQIWTYEFTLETSDVSLELGFGANLDYLLVDEAFGIDNLTIVENSNTLQGTVGNDVILDEDGARDVIFANAGDDTVTLEATVNTSNTFNANFEMIDGGVGQDTLRLADAGDLDLTKVDNLKLQSIEAIDLTNGATNELTLSLQDVLDLSETVNTEFASALDGMSPALTHSDNETLVISGDTADTVNFAAGAAGDSWVDTGRTVTVGGQQHDVVNYTNSTGDVLASVAIDTDVTTTGTT